MDSRRADRRRSCAGVFRVNLRVFTDPEILQRDISIRFQPRSFDFAT
jgi:hypothetical protein